MRNPKPTNIIHLILYKVNEYFLDNVTSVRINQRLSAGVMCPLLRSE